MKAPFSILFALSGLLLLNGCPGGGDGPGGNITLGGSGASNIVYVANQTSNDVSAYTINATTGALTAVAGGAVAAGTTPSAVTVSPNGAFAYVTNSGSNNVSAYTINATTGALTAVAGGAVAAGTTPSAVTVSPNGAFAYVTNSGSNNVSAYTINATTGALTAVAGGAVAAGTTPSAAVVSPNGAFLFVANQGSSNISVYTIDSGTGAVTALLGGTGNPFAAGTTPVGITITPNGTFVHVANSGSNNVSAFSVNTGTGALTALAGGIGNPFAAGTTPAGITLTPNASFVYVANGGSNNVSAYTLDSGTGVLTALAGGTGNPFAAGTVPSGIATPGRP